MFESAASKLICRLYRKEYDRFLGIRDLKSVQTKKLSEILRANESCAYLRGHTGRPTGSIQPIQSADDFRAAFPLTEYEDYLPYIERIAAGEKNVLTTEDVLCFQTTGGSTSASKLIPYTASLKREFQNGLRPWLCDLYTNGPGLGAGKAYWSVTPAIHERRRTEGGVPIGFEDDTAYFGGLFERLSGILLVTPDIPDGAGTDDFYRITAEALLRCRRLTFLSVWNPTLLTLILEYIETHCGAEKRAFPQLKMISCWCDATAARYLPKLRALLPHAEIQPKGLLSTEGFVSVPILGETGARLAATSHFFEFLSAADGRAHLAHELTPGEEYEVVLTTSGGLYRYRTHDVVLALDRTPRLRFLGRNGKVSDLFGEKLNERFISAIMETVESDFCMLAPETDYYILYIKTETIPLRFEEELMKNFHYQYCRDLGQLKPLRIFRLTGDPASAYLAAAAENGQKLGGIKPPALSLTGGWTRIFEGAFVHI